MYLAGLSTSSLLFLQAGSAGPAGPGQLARLAGLAGRAGLSGLAGRPRAPGALKGKILPKFTFFGRQGPNFAKIGLFLPPGA